MESGDDSTVSLMVLSLWEDEGFPDWSVLGSDLSEGYKADSDRVGGLFVCVRESETYLAPCVCVE